ncbi:MAG: pantetheine-phosphate adenylyltransferase [Bacteroidales bacterium]|nr:pantetheine-phosphate adenylyltransferase [Bacteroidales bacterium]
MAERIAVFPGSFDPITLGHEAIITRALTLFDKIIVGIGINIEKKYLFPVQQRKIWIAETFKNNPRIEVDTYSGLTVDFCRKCDSHFIIRGLRTSADFEFERIVGQVNKKLYPDIETIFLLAAPEFSSLNSSIVRDIVINGGDASMFVPKCVAETIQEGQYENGDK